MLVLGSIQLLVAGFPDGPLQPDLAVCLRDLEYRAGAKVLDFLYVSRDSRGVLSVHLDEIDVEGGPAYPGVVLLQVLEGDHIAESDEAEYEVGSAREIGFDLEAVEGVVYLIPPGTSALLVLVEARWTELFLDVVSRAGGVSRGLGFLEAETMLIVGPQLALAQKTFADAERASVARGQGMLAALRLASGREAAVVAEALAALVAGGVLREAHLATSIAVLAKEGVLAAAPSAESG